MRTSNRLRRTLAIATIAAMWVVATEPWGLSVLELLPFVAPGALMGLAASWIAAALSPARWRWRDGLDGAVLGATMLPPIFAFLVALAGTGQPQHTLEALVLLAWLALAAGATAALAGYVWRALRGGTRLRATPRRSRRSFPTRTSVHAADAPRRIWTPWWPRDHDRGGT